MSLRTTNHHFFKTLVVAGLALQCAAPAFALEKVVHGQVRDDKLKALGGVRVELWTKDGSVSKLTRTDSDGNFSFSHEKVPGMCFLEVYAPKKSQLASALVDDIPGDEGRSVIVTLKRGFPVTGRVLGNGKPLKDVIVKAFSTNHAKSRTERVYGGGAVSTARNGEFKLTLTPGEKKIVLINKEHSELAKGASLAVKVFNDTELGDIEIPSK